MPAKRPVALVAPLDWGLGHATRCMPVIRELLDMGWEVIIAADRSPLILLQEAFPQLESIRLEGAHIIYPKRGGVVMHFVLQTPGFLRSVYREHQALQRILKSRSIDLVISDNRYGLYSNRVPSILISHQLRIRVPGVPVAESAVSRFVRFYAARFKEVWVPDWSGPQNLSGILSSGGKLPRHIRYIGPLSRFSASGSPGYLQDPALDPEWEEFFRQGPYPLLFLVSGPEPAVSVFRKVLKEQALELNIKTLMVLGQPSGKLELRQEKQLFSIGHLPSHVLAKVLEDTELVVCRSGYSTLMDLAVYGKKALLVPTPGQSEQTYLAQRFMENGWSHSVKQNRLNLAVDLAQARACQGIKSPFNPDELKKGIKAAYSAG